MQVGLVWVGAIIYPNYSHITPRNPQSMQVGLGWVGGSLRSKRWRWTLQHDLHADLGFGADAMQLLQVCAA